MKTKYLLLVLAALVTMTTAVYQAKADAVLFVSPTRVNLDEKKKVEVINISNVSNVSRTYKISLVDQVMNEKGTTLPKDSFEYSAKKMIRFFPREFTVAPGERQAIRVMVKIPADTPDGEYHSHIKFFQDANSKKDNEPISGQSSKARVTAPFSYSTLIPITVTRGKIDTQVGWSDQRIEKNNKPNSYIAKLKLTRQGNGQGTAYLETKYIAPSGEETIIGKRRTVYIYREINVRDSSYEIVLPQGASPAGKIKISLLGGSKTNPALINEVLLSIP